MTNRSAPVVLMYSHDGVGFGHLRRNLNIASRLVEEHPGASVLLLAGFSGVPDLQFPSGVDLVKLPSVRKVDTDRWVPRTLRVHQEQVLRIRRDVIQAVQRSLNPDAFLVDYVPEGIGGELLPTLRQLKARPAPPLIALGLRDILDSPERTRRLWQARGTYSVLSRFYDRVLVYGRREMFDTACHYRLNDAVADRTRYVGYVTSDVSPRPVEETRKRLSILPGRKFVLVTAGAGSDAFPMMRLCLHAIQSLKGAESLHVVLVTGPLMSSMDREALRRACTRDALRVVATLEDMASAMRASDLVLTMGGYNSLIEALHLRKPVVAIPRQGPSAEQSLRTRLFERLKLLQSIPVSASPAALAAVVRTQLAQPRLPPSLVDRDALSVAVSELLGAGAAVPHFELRRGPEPAVVPQAAHPRPRRAVS